MHDNMIEWWVLYRFAALGNFLDGYPEGTLPRVPADDAPSLWEPTIVRLMANFATDDEPCALCWERKQETCPGMKLHVAIERDRAELEAGALVSTAVVALPAGLGWDVAMLAVKRMIADRKVIPQQ
ncbi:hypothetical protein G3I59_36805 [Amycolatopsis rubida]|uniref:Uncharacterized protein n=1 Tax=Amycolatopsis rubida TaxID=112413 RepID=A0ABX0BZV5_9PSEU|nr:MULTISPECIES: hypothetical protein [Amycolatopsis]MYW96020.1 hypothetical protein [Amycolatopsis rubida]NEC61011.1 hypothetical protein [Amycolatopsis rubida]